MELDYERNCVHGDPSFEAELCVARSPSLVYKKREPPAPKVEEADSKNRTLSPSMISIGRKNNKTATRSEGDEEVEVQKTGTEEMGIEMDEEKITVLSKEVTTKNNKEMETENAKVVGTEKKIEEVEKEVKEGDTVNTVTKGSGAADVEAGPSVELTKCATTKFCFIRDS